MNLNDLEELGKKTFEQFPMAKKTAKRVYHGVSTALDGQRFHQIGDLYRVSPDDSYEYLCGYYDKSPWDMDDRFLLALKVRGSWKSVAPKEYGIVCVIDTHNENKVFKIGISHSWNVQQGCMAQWLGPDFRERIIYNDFREGHYCSVIYNLRERREERILNAPVYDVSRDGKTALSLDFSRLHRMRPGYGYSNLPDDSVGQLCPDSPCIWKINLESGRIDDLLRYTDLVSFEPDETMKNAEHKVNHLMISPDGKRFMLLHRWFNKGRKHTRLVTVNMDGTLLYNLSDDGFVSHCYWKNDREILSFLRKDETGKHYYLMKDKSQDYSLLWPELNTDGHCSYSSDGKMIVTDTYPDRKRTASVYLCSEQENCSTVLARVHAPFRYDFECRCDLHPRWDREGDLICIDSVHEGKRGIYVIRTPKYYLHHPVDTKIPRIIHSVWVGGAMKSPNVLRSEKSWHFFCPGFQFMEWNENNFNIENCDSAYVKEAYKTGKWAFVSDYIRLKALYEYGGIYMDSDMEMFRNPEYLLSGTGFVGAESRHTISCGVIGTVPRAPWIGDLIKEYDKLNFIKEDGSLDLLPITKRMQSYFEEKFNYQPSDEIQEVSPGVFVYPTEYFAPLNCYTGINHMTSNTFSFHHGDNSWKSASDKVKKKFMQYGTRVIGEDNRAALVKMKDMFK